MKYVPSSQTLVMGQKDTREDLIDDGKKYYISAELNGAEIWGIVIYTDSYQGVDYKQGK